MANYIKAFELCGMDKQPQFRLKGGYIIWESITYRNSDRCVISRVVEHGGKPFFMGLNYLHRYISPDTLVEIFPSEGVN